MEQSLGKLCELRDIARDLDRNVRNSWLMILGPNIACIAGVFTLGFGIGASVVTNNIAALAALANGLLPMRRVAQLEAERRHILEMELRQGGLLRESGSLVGPAALVTELVSTAEGDADSLHRYGTALAAD
jgi:Cu2+-exporting ATPase